jgi:deoxyguanosine kinase
MLISIDGCVGSGKTTVTKGLASVRRSTVLLETFEMNPFLREFYSNPAQTAIEAEFSFLLLHFHQLKSVAAGIADSEIIADFHLGKDLVYANLNLPDLHVKRLFKELYEVCLLRVPRPELLVFLSAPTALIIERINARGRDFELAIDADYYAAINAAYEESYCSYGGAKMRLQMEEWDFVSDSSLYGKLSSLIDGKLACR